MQRMMIGTDTSKQGIDIVFISAVRIWWKLLVSPSGVMFDQSEVWLTSSVKVSGGPLPSELELVLKVLFRPRENTPSLEFMIEILPVRSGVLPDTDWCATYQISSHLL